MKGSSTVYELTQNVLVNNHELRDYLKNLRDWHGYIRFLGLPDRRDNPDILIDRLFVEPLLSRRQVSPDENPALWISKAETVFDILKVGKPTIILGDPGTGKSTLFNYLVWLLARPTEKIWMERMGRWLLPIPMVLRELDLSEVIDFRGLLNAFFDHPMSEPLRETTFLDQKLNEGNVLFLLDGIDELGDVNSRKNLRNAVFEGFELYPHCQWLLSSRVVGYDEVPFNNRLELQQFYSDSPSPHVEVLKKSATLKPKRITLESNTSSEFLGTKFNIADSTIIRYIAPFDEPRIEAFALNWYMQREAAETRANTAAVNLVKAVHADYSILRLARVPNLLTMMALIHRIETTLPHGRALLYERIAEAYLESIDKYRGVYSGAYNFPQKMRWLARVAYELQLRRSDDRDQENGLSKSELLVESQDVISWIKEELSPSTNSESLSAEEFLDYVGRRSGLFLPRSENRYAFVHLSFQEYFAALALEREVTSPNWVKNEYTPLGLKRDTVSKLAESKVWRETFLFLFELLSSKESWHSEFLNAVFGINYEKVNLESSNSSAIELTLSLAFFATNRRTGFSSSTKQRAVDTVILNLLKFQESELSNKRTSIDRRKFQFNFKELFSDDSVLNEEILKKISCQVKKLQIRHLFFSQTHVTDVSPLAGLESLELLDLQGTHVTDLEPLSELASLKSLYLTDTQVTDLSPLANLKSLEILDLENSLVTDVSPLAGLASLKVIDLENSLVTDVSPLAGLASLGLLDLRGTHVTNLEPLSELAALKCLLLLNTEVTDVSPLAGLASLELLDLRLTKVTDLNPLANLKSLEILDLENSLVTDVSPLAGLASLEMLDLRGTRVTELEPLSGLAALKKLYLVATEVTNISPLANLKSLEILDLENSPVTDVSPLAGLASLEFLDLRGTHVIDLEPLSGLNSLESLYLTDTQVTDLSPLANLKSLEILDLENSLVTDVSPLAGLASLEMLDLRGTGVTNLEPLSELTALNDLII